MPYKSFSKSYNEYTFASCSLILVGFFPIVNLITSFNCSIFIAAPFCNLVKLHFYNTIFLDIVKM